MPNVPKLNRHQNKSGLQHIECVRKQVQKDTFVSEHRPCRETLSSKKPQRLLRILWKALQSGWALFRWEDYEIEKTGVHLRTVNGQYTVCICYSVGLWFLKTYHYNRCIITTDVHGLESNREHLFPGWAFPSKIYKILNSIGFRVLFEHSFSLIHRSFFLLWPTDEKKICGEENSEMSSTGLLSYHYKWYFLCRIWWFDFSVPIVISDISLQPICTGYSDILNVFLRIWFWFLSILS